MRDTNLFPDEPSVIETIVCDHLDRSLAVYTGENGYRLFSIFPADSPREAIVEREGNFLKLEQASSDALGAGTDHSQESVYSPDWKEGRAGMQYRDLIPGRLGGKLIASHIRIQTGGPIPDYVHFHKVVFQVICCIKGWCKLVYEDQGEPFVFEAGDCLLQPPGIRHRVLECSGGFEVVELSSPAEHPTYAEHGFGLPTETRNCDRIFSGQRFLHAKFGERNESSKAEGISICRTGIHEASAGAVDVEVVTVSDSLASPLSFPIPGNTFLFIVTGSVEVADKASDLHLFAGDPAVIGGEFVVRSAVPGTRFLRFTLG